eukprot:scaffold458733_cov25-Prasinocladus_malaysianus.AAC.1
MTWYTLFIVLTIHLADQAGDNEYFEVFCRLFEQHGCGSKHCAAHLRQPRKVSINPSGLDNRLLVTAEQQRRNALQQFDSKLSVPR